MAILGPRVFYGKIPYSFSTENDDGTGYGQVATTVMDKPWAVLVPTLVILWVQVYRSCTLISQSHAT